MTIKEATSLMTEEEKHEFEHAIEIYERHSKLVFDLSRFSPFDCKEIAQYLLRIKKTFDSSICAPTKREDE